MTKNCLDYLQEYKDVSFNDMSFNDVDASIFSLITYLDIKSGLLRNSINYFLNNTDKKKFIKNGYKNKDLWNMAMILLDSKRYSDIKVSDVIKRITINEQFKALSFRFDKTLVIAYEGTDETLIGWEEDLALSYTFPVKAETDAINYINRVIGIKDRNVYVVGHSKGGHLALVAGMYANMFNKFKIKKIYSFDGPGLRDQELNSLRYKMIEKKFKHFIPEYSFIGILLKHKDAYIIKSTRKDFKCHVLFTWNVEGNSFKLGTISKRSLNLYNNLNEWLDNHNEYEREMISKQLFNTFRSLGLTYYNDLKKFNNMVKIVIKSKDMDKYTKKLLISLGKYVIDSFLNKDTF